MSFNNSDLPQEIPFAPDDKTLIKKLYYDKKQSVHNIIEIPHFKRYSQSEIYSMLEIKENEKELINEVNKLYYQGYTKTYISRLLNISRYMVYQYIKIGEKGE